MRPLAAALGLIGTVVALTGVWAHIVNWLVLLGVVVPPIGAVLIVDYVLTRRREPERARVRPIAFAAWGIGAVAAGLAHYHLPGSVGRGDRIRHRRRRARRSHRTTAGRGAHARAVVCRRLRRRGEFR